MCLPLAGAAAGSAAAISATTAVIGTVTSVAGTAMGIMQAQQQAQMAQQQAVMQANQAQQTMDLQYKQQQQQGQAQNKQAIANYQGQVRAQQASQNAYQAQIGNINEAASMSYVAEQVKLNEKRDAAAFKSQEIYAKSIGAQGKILASGATGQSVGLLQTDAERQAGFATAKQNAMLRSAEQQSDVSQQVAYNQAQSSANTAYSSVQAPAQAPELDPYGLELGIPSMNWS